MVFLIKKLLRGEMKGRADVAVLVSYMDRSNITPTILT